MNDLKLVHELVPFPSSAEGVGFSVKGKLSISSQSIEIEFFIKDQDLRILKPEASEKATILRADELWKTTCFELFMSPVGQTEYYEINISPTGAWNAYYFEGYRSPQAPTATNKVELQELQWTGESLKASLRFQSEGLANLAWDCSLTAVIETTGHQKFYLAASHAGEKPDFHLRKSFILKRGQHT